MLDSGMTDCWDQSGTEVLIIDLLNEADRGERDKKRPLSEVRAAWFDQAR